MSGPDELLARDIADVEYGCSQAEHHKSAAFMVRTGAVRSILTANAALAAPLPADVAEAVKIAVDCIASPAPADTAALPNIDVEWAKDWLAERCVCENQTNRCDWCTVLSVLESTSGSSSAFWFVVAKREQAANAALAARCGHIVAALDLIAEPGLTLEEAQGCARRALECDAALASQAAK